MITLVAAISLLFPDSCLEPWRLKPLVCIGGVGGVTLFAITVQSVNLIGDLIEAISGLEPRAMIGIPIEALIIIYLLKPKVRQFFSSRSSS